MTDPYALSESGEVRHRARATVLEPWIVSKPDGRSGVDPREVMVVGAGVARWASGLDPDASRFIGIEVSENLLADERARHPRWRFELLSLSPVDMSLPVEDASLDLALCVTVVQDLSSAARRNLISEMWRATRPGGRLLFLEEFVFKNREDRTVAPISISRFMDLLLEATDGRVILEHMEALRYPDEDMHRAGLLSLNRLGPLTRPAARTPPDVRSVPGQRRRAASE